MFDYILAIADFCILLWAIYLLGRVLVNQREIENIQREIENINKYGKLLKRVVDDKKPPSIVDIFKLRKYTAHADVSLRQLGILKIRWPDEKQLIEEIDWTVQYLVRKTKGVG